MTILAANLLKRSKPFVGRPLSSVVYKTGHHGAKSSNSETFLRDVQPQSVIVSTGEGNNYGHPHEVAQSGQ
jgi:competence protein ComEC